ncbi:hypothetical protein AC630_15785 [Bradyrhizobium sp. AS23.2]|nr:hypothetical protein AC630_15785 [Bradyrhizobium sp. AS23.2]
MIRRDTWLEANEPINALAAIIVTSCRSLRRRDLLISIQVRSDFETGHLRVLGGMKVLVFPDAAVCCLILLHGRLGATSGRTLRAFVKTRDVLASVRQRFPRVGRRMKSY